MAITRIKNNQITDATITNAKLVPGTITGGTLSSNLTYEGNLIISGNLSVTGTTTVVDTVNTSVADPIIVLSRNATGSAIVDSGLIIERGDDINQALIWDESLDEFAMFSTSDAGDTSGDIAITAYANLKLATVKIDTLSNQAGTASPKIAGLTATRVTFAGTNGILTDDSDLTYSDGNLSVDGVVIGNNTITTSTGNLALDSAGGTITSDNTINLTANVISNSTSTGTIVVTGGVGISGNLNVGGNVSLGNLNSDLITANTGNIGTVNSTTGSFTGNLSAGNLSSNGSASITGNLSAGNIGTTGELTVTGNANVGDLNTDTVVANTGNITDINTANITVSNWANITSTTASTTTTTGALIVAGGIGLAGNINMGGNLAAADGSFSGNVIVTGNLTVDGTTTFVNTETTTVKDPVIVIGGGDGGSAATSDDNKDRGIQFQWHTGSAPKSGFFGFDDSTGKFTFIPDATIAADVVSGTAGDVEFGNVSANFGTFTGNISAGNISAAGFLGNVSSSGTSDFSTITVSTVANITSTTSSTSTTSGALIVAGGAGLAGNVYVGGLVNVTGNITGGNLSTGGILSVTGNATTGNLSTTTATITTGNITTVNAGTVNVSTLANITATTASTDTVTGALLVAGGVGITGNINVGGSVSKFTEATVSNSSTTGTVVISGGLGVAGNIYAGNLAIVGSSIISSNTNGNIEIQPDGIGITVINPSGANDTNIQGNVDANLFYVDASSDNIGVGTNAPNAGAKIHINSTDSIIVPIGNSAERPISPAAGMLRFNTDVSVVEYYDGTSWVDSVVDFTVITSDVFEGDGSTLEFTISQANTTSGAIVSINGVVQLPTTAYGISGTTLTFTEAPATGDKIEVRGITTSSTVTNLFSSNGYVGVDAQNSGLDIYSGGSSRVKRVTLDNNGTLSVLANIASTSTTSGSFTVAGGVGIVGDVNVGGTLTDNFADIAENYQADADYEPGTVLEFGGKEEVTICTNAMCKRVAGVVTTDPAIIMNGDLRRGYVAAIALLGRVPVKVSGTVRKGDMMVSAGDGRARAEENPVIGSVIGKALEDFDGEEGVIEVVVGRL